MKKKRIHRTPGEWQRLFSEQERSGQSQAAFCAARGIGLSGYREARRRIGPVSEFVELTPTERWESEVSFPNGMIIRIRRA